VWLPATTDDVALPAFAVAWLLLTAGWAHSSKPAAVADGTDAQQMQTPAPQAVPVNNHMGMPVINIVLHGMS